MRLRLGVKYPGSLVPSASLPPVFDQEGLEMNETKVGCKVSR